MEKISTRFTKRFGLKHPIALAPMTPAAGGVLASAVAEAGGLGLLGGGYVDRAWFEAESAKVTRPDIGVGFIAWTIPEDPGLLDTALERYPRAMMLSYSDPGPYAKRIKKAGVPIICQVSTLEHALHAVDVGADVVIAQGTEAGGHGLGTRSTLPFVPTVVDALAVRAPDVLVLAAGGIADGRGLAAALMLGADGVLMGTRFYGTQEALVPAQAKAAVVAATGDETVRTSVYDIANNKSWPPGYTGRVVRNEFVEKWHGREKELAGVRAEELKKVQHAFASGDFDVGNVTVGEAIGLVHDIPKAGDLINRIVAEASARLVKFAPALIAA
ncbi:MAG: nitronate monooxygenase [Candidatus Eremiobacteraeota bacterium]|nr:nitronate monooxygenase [Candidatus Eremiobacteraeota bacterium]